MSTGSPTQLAAIMFTDIAGYSRLMEEDEERTIRLLKHHNEIVLPLIESAGGEVIDAIGDGLFVLYPSVREAVHCGARIQDAIAHFTSTKAPEERFALRIGVHLGEIWRDADRVYGNGVNVAARVQPFARPGGICITEDVYRQIANKTQLPLRSLGVQSLRNIERPIELFEVSTGNETERKQIPVENGHDGELDSVKERILKAREMVATKRAQAQRAVASTGGTAPADSSAQVESKVFSFVEKVMDKAITKWEEMPEEKKQRAIAKIEAGIEKGLAESETEVDVTIAGRHLTAAGKKREKESQDVISRITTGMVFSAGFGLGYFFFGIGWMVWPFAIIGVLPLVTGIAKGLKLRRKVRKQEALRPAELERTVLKLAGKLGGTVTVVQIASAGGLTLDEAQKTLDAMTLKGYVLQHIRETGVIEYEFPSLTGS